MPSPRASSASCRCATCRPGSRWPTVAPAAARGSATCSPRRTFRSESPVKGVACDARPRTGGLFLLVAALRQLRLAEVRLADLLVLAQALGVVGESYVAGLEHVAAIGRVEGHQGVLL